MDKCVYECGDAGNKCMHAMEYCIQVHAGSEVGLARVLSTRH